ncbi:procathepsin L-like [Styela clava]|uniref:procathepsin L-like n=1 Tax=Styela clava TaxID=7725 RepID=UPI00193A4D56|nr:procathepsin L-like [Styela clava]XP_039258210.1 procathepsin L-like [Styela clava]
MKLFIVLSCLVAASLASVLTMTHTDYEWEAWKAKYEKTYYDEKDEAVRRYIWGKNQAFVDKHNHEAAQGKHTYTVGMNKFADLESEEFAKIFLGKARQGPWNTPGCSNSSIYVTSRYYGESPTEVDWTKKGYVTGVKDQAACGSCWAFSTTGSLEGQHFHSTGKLVSLSEQNLMDCSKPEGDFSCEGGLMDNAFDYIIANGGVDTEASYPYQAMDEQQCRYTKKDVGATMTSCVDVTPHGDEQALKKAVGTIGPISVAIDASQISFHLYKSGVYSEPGCSSTILDHGVLAVGYGTDTNSGSDYWLVKNSWGLSWGMQGYIKMSRNANNQCGIATSASYPVV